MRSSDADGSKFMMVQLFMFRLGPPPLSALMYVPIHGSRKSGGEFYESRAATASSPTARMATHRPISCKRPMPPRGAR